MRCALARQDHAKADESPWMLPTAAATNPASPGTLVMSAARDDSAIELTHTVVCQRIGRHRCIPSQLVKCRIVRPNRFEVLQLASGKKRDREEVVVGIITMGRTSDVSPDGLGHFRRGRFSSEIRRTDVSGCDHSLNGTYDLVVEVAVAEMLEH